MSRELWHGTSEYSTGMYAHAFWGGETGPRIQFPCDNGNRYVSLDASEVRELANVLCIWLEDVAKGGPAFGAGGGFPQFLAGWRREAG